MVTLEAYCAAAEEYASACETFGTLVFSLSLILGSIGGIIAVLLVGYTVVNSLKR